MLYRLTPAGAVARRADVAHRGVGVGRELSGLDGEARRTGLSVAAAFAVTLAAPEITEGLLPALAVGPVLSVGAEDALRRR